MSSPEKTRKNPYRLFSLARPYLALIIVILIFNLLANGLGLFLPKLVAGVIDSFSQPDFKLINYVKIISAVSIAVFIFSAIQSILQTYLSELVARDLRTKLIDKISRQHFSFIVETTPEKLLTNLTADVDNLKMAISQALIQMFSSLVVLIGASVLLISINFGLALIVLTIVPLIGTIFFLIFRQVRKYFLSAQQIIDKLNKTINESMVAAPLIRILNSGSVENQKFNLVSSEARENGLSILKLFSALIPVISIIANSAVVMVLYTGGRSIMNGTFSIGSLSAFLSYISLLIFPILVLGFISNLLARAGVSYERIYQVINSKPPLSPGKLNRQLNGNIRFSHVNLSFDNKPVLKDVSFVIKAHSKTAILGPTAAGKTQLFYLLSGLLPPTSGKITIDNFPLSDYSAESLSSQIGLVFQDSSIFNTSIKENISFNKNLSDIDLQKAIETAELKGFIDRLPHGLDTKIAERGSNLSGGQKQRLTLARALALNPKILLLDDFTARVDKETEKNIFTNISKNYSLATRVLITQQISSVVDYDQIILLMEGEVLAVGTHQQLLKKSPEYQQIYNSQMSTS